MEETQINRHSSIEVVVHEKYKLKGRPTFKHSRNSACAFHEREFFPEMKEINFFVKNKITGRGFCSGLFRNWRKLLYHQLVSYFWEFGARGLIST